MSALCDDSSLTVVPLPAPVYSVVVVLTLPEQDVADSRVYVVVDGVSAVDHQAVHKLHGLCPLTPELAGHHDLTTFGSTLHDEPQHAIAGPAPKHKSETLYRSIPERVQSRAVTTAATARNMCQYQKNKNIVDAKWVVFSIYHSNRVYFTKNSCFNICY